MPFLVAHIPQGIDPKTFEHREIDDIFLKTFSLDELDMTGLLFQTGYLTIKSIQLKNLRPRYILGYPNNEVYHSMILHLAKAFSRKPSSVVSQALIFMERGLEEGNIALFIDQLKIILSDISYHLKPKKNQANEAGLFKMWEGYFQTIVYLVTSYMKLSVQTEVTKHQGRLDLIAQTDNFLYLMEFKLDEPAKNAIAQIKSRAYAASYKNSPKVVYLVGINFSKEERNVGTWKIEEWKRD